MSVMRAKMQVQQIKQTQGCEELSLGCVMGNQPWGPKGESEDNTFARYSPSGSLTISITNPDLHGKFKPGQKFYLDFTEAD